MLLCMLPRAKRPADLGATVRAGRSDVMPDPGGHHSDAKMGVGLSYARPEQRRERFKHGEQRALCANLSDPLFP